MELVNTTAIPAALRVATTDHEGVRLGLVVAKATFTIAADPVLSADLAEPVYDKDVETDDGLLPTDVILRRIDGIEVILLGRAHAPGNRDTRSMQVTMQVGDFSRELSVFGDRVWEGNRPSVPAPFRAMPLTWDRAFGGTVEAWIDADSAVPISDPINPAGRGFDARGPADRLCRMLRASAEYPVIASPRPLPNLENPEQLIQKPSDNPVPACWATTPPGLGLATLQQEPDILQRCHPAWALPQAPSRGARVVLGGVAAGTLQFQFPALRVAADIEHAGTHKSVVLTPQMLVLRPAHTRFHVTYRAVFPVAAPSTDHRCLRLRVEA